MSISTYNTTNFNRGCGIAIDKRNNVYISHSYYNNRGSYNVDIVKIDKLGNVSSFASGIQIRDDYPEICFDKIGFTNGYLYQMDYYNRTIYKIDVNGNRTLFRNLINPFNSVAFDNNNILYYGNRTQIYKVDSNGNETVFIETGLGGSDFINRIAFDSYNNLYTTTRISGQNYIRKYNSDGILVNTEFISIPNIFRILDINIDKYNNIYFGYQTRDTGSNYTYGNDLVKYDSSGNFISNIYHGDDNGIRYFTINSSGKLFFTDGFMGSAIVKLYTPPSPPPEPITCFKEDTKILTNKGYVLIQDLKIGDLVITLRHGYKPIDMIGYKQIENVISKERIKDKLYICTNEDYPEIFEDLIITGCHSILVDGIKEEEKEKITDILGSIFVTDKKYRMPACVDNRAKPYEEYGVFTIYHIALENNDYYMNYGIYANGLIVETCSKRYLKEISGMTLI